MCDYSSIAGTWRNELGHEIVFNKSAVFILSCFLVKFDQVLQIES
ncbi:hypothetical protein LPB406_01705 [Streptococcus sp. LPB0406]|nr:hypothetical protein [Streptococcus sp. LPB0406]